MYILKIKGNGKIPNYLQVRDNDFNLIAYFKADKIREGFTKNNMSEYIEEVESVVNEMQFGVIKKINDK